MLSVFRSTPDHCPVYIPILIHLFSYIRSQNVQPQQTFVKPGYLFQFQGDHIDLGAYGHQQVDRFAVLLDLWTNEAAYLENKRQVINLVIDRVAEIIVDIAKSIICFRHVTFHAQSNVFEYQTVFLIQLRLALLYILRLHCLGFIYSFSSFQTVTWKLITMFLTQKKRKGLHRFVPI